MRAGCSSVREADARSEVAEIIVHATGRKVWIAGEHESNRRMREPSGVRSGNVAAHLVCHRIGVRKKRFPAEAEIQSQIAPEFPIVLNESRVLLAPREFHLTSGLRERRDIPKQEIGQAIAGEAAIETIQRFFLITGTRIEADVRIEFCADEQRVAAVHVIQQFGGFQVLAQPFAGRLRRPAPPTRKAGDGNSSFQKFGGGFGNVRISEIKDGEGRGASLIRIQDKTVDHKRIDQAWRDAERIADFCFGGGLNLAEAVIQQRAVAVPTGVGIIHEKSTGGKLVPPQCVIDFRQSLVVARGARLRIEEQTGGIRRGRDLGENAGAQWGNEAGGNDVCGKSLESFHSGEVALALGGSGDKCRVVISDIVYRRPLVAREVKELVLQNGAADGSTELIPL